MFALSFAELLILLAVAWCIWRAGRANGFRRALHAAQPVWVPVQASPTGLPVGGIVRVLLFGLALGFACLIGIGLVSVIAAVAYVPSAANVEFTPGSAPRYWVPSPPAPVAERITAVVPEVSEIPPEIPASAEIPLDIPVLAGASAGLAPEAEAGRLEDPLGDEAPAMPDSVTKSSEPTPQEAASPPPPAEGVPIAEVPPAVEPGADASAPVESSGARPKWLDGQLPDEPNTRFQVVPTATFLTRDRAEEAIQTEALHALLEFAGEVSRQLHVPNRYSPPLSEVGRIIRDQYMEVLEDGSGYRGHALIAFTSAVREEIALGLSESLVKVRLHGVGRAMGLLITMLGVVYGGLRLVGGKPALIR